MNLNNIPQELMLLPQWVCTKGDSKMPIDALYGTPASSTNPQTWSHFPTAKGRVELGIFDHVGFVFNDNGIVGVDIDDG